LGNPVDYLVYAVAFLLLGSVAMFIKHAIFNRRPQKVGLVFAILAVPLFAIYYSDRSPWNVDDLRRALDPLKNMNGADLQFESDISPALILAVLVVVHLIIIQRLGMKERLRKVQSPIATFLASAMFATMFGGIVVSTFHRGYVGALIVGGVYTLVYLGALAVLASVVEIFVELSKLFVAWIKRWILALATLITRLFSFISSLAGRLGLTNLAERIRQETAEQETTYRQEQEMQDRELYAAYVRDRARQRRAAGKEPDVELEITGDLPRKDPVPVQRAVEENEAPA
jgi:hypothetical protein